MTIGQAVSLARTRLISAGIDNDEAARDADLLLRHAAAWDRATFVASTHEPLPSSIGREYAQLIDRRCTREPVAYVRGVQEFWGREFLVSPAVLIPRPETELIVEEALVLLTAPNLSEPVGTSEDPSEPSRTRRNLSEPFGTFRNPSDPSGTCRNLSEPFRVVDVGTGSGCLAISIACECSHVSVIAIDISVSALKVARANAVRFGVASRLRFAQGEYLTAVTGAADLIVANPPYVAEADRSTLSPEVGEFEPAVALFAGPDGLHVIRELIAQAGSCLAQGGTLIMEIGAGQIEAVRQIVAATHGLMVAKVREDLRAIPRVVVIHQIERSSPW